MTKYRTEALVTLLDSLDNFEVVSDYFDDIEPQGITDSLLSGKIDALRAFCLTLGWTELVAQIQLTPLHGNALEALSIVREFAIPEIRHRLAVTDVEAMPSSMQWFWDLLHPRIRSLARPRVEAGFLGDAVEASFKEVNDSVKHIVKNADGRELDGAGLMNTAFSPQNPIIRLTSMSSDSEVNKQKGYMLIMAGAMTGIRNPNAHANENPDSAEALHLVCLASLLMCKLDQRP